MAGVLIKSGKAHMDVSAIHRFLSEESYWAKGISFELVDKSPVNSFCVGAFIDDKQVGNKGQLYPAKLILRNYF